MQNTDNAVFSQVPTLTDCFRNIIVRPLPPIFFLLCFACIIRRLIHTSFLPRQSTTVNGRSDNAIFNGPFSRLTIAKYFLLALLICTFLAEIAINAIYNKIFIFSHLLAICLEIFNFVCSMTSTLLLMKFYYNLTRNSI